MVEAIAQYLGITKWLVRTVLGGGLFVGTLFVSLGVVTLVLVKLPADHFTNEAVRVDSSRHPAVRWMARVGKNAAGLFLIILGFVMSLPGIPGQGILTMFIGLMLLDFPGKVRLERKILARRRILRAVNGLRARFGKPPLILRRTRGQRAKRTANHSSGSPR